MLGCLNRKEVRNEMKDLKAIVLAGGFATRLRPLTLTKPKPLLTVLGKPLLEWIVEMLSQAGIKDIVISVRYMSQVIRNRLGNGTEYSVNIIYVEEDKPLGDAGPLTLIADEVGLNDTFIVVYGDIFCDIDLTKVVEFHKQKGGLITIVLAKVDDPSRYGVAVLDEDSRIINFVEKPKSEEAPSNLVNAGIYVFEPEALRYIPKKAPSKLARDLIPRLVNDKLVYGYVYHGIWGDIGVPKDYLRINIEVLRKYYPNGYIDADSKVSEKAEIIQPVFIGKNVQIAEESFIGPFAIIEDDVKVGKLARIKKSLIQIGTFIEQAAYISGSIIGERCHIGKWARIDEEVVIGDEVNMSDEVYIARNVKILPFKEIDRSVYSAGEIIL